MSFSQREKVTEGRMMIEVPHLPCGHPLPFREWKRAVRFLLSKGEGAPEGRMRGVEHCSRHAPSHQAFAGTGLATGMTEHMAIDE